MKPPENLQNLAILSSGNALFDIEKALQNGHSCSFAEKGRGLGPPRFPTNCAPAVSVYFDL